jgi:hypothetical protein
MRRRGPRGGAAGLHSCCRVRRRSEAMNSKWLPAPVALFTDHNRAVRTLPWCLEIGHAPVHRSAASAGAGSSGDDPLAEATIHPDVQAMQDELVADRRWLHAHAELSFEEDETHVYIAEKLRAMGARTPSLPSPPRPHMTCTAQLVTLFIFSRRAHCRHRVSAEDGSWPGARGISGSGFELPPADQGHWAYGGHRRRGRPRPLRGTARRH